MCADTIIKPTIQVSVLLVQGECEGFYDVLEVYNEITPTIKLGGPTNFAPLIDEAVNVVQRTNEVSSSSIPESAVTE